MAFWLFTLGLCNNRLCIYPMLYASRLSTTPKRNLIRHIPVSLVKVGHQTDAWLRYESLCVMCLSQGNNDALPTLEPESRVDVLQVANLPFYPLNYAAAIFGILTLSAFTRKRTSNLSITIWGFCKLSYAADRAKRYIITKFHLQI